MKTTIQKRLARLERLAPEPEDPTGRMITKLLAMLIAIYLGNYRPGAEPPAAAYSRALGYPEPRYLLEGMIREPDEHLRRDAEARARLFGTVGVDLHTAKPEAIIGALERLVVALPDELRVKIIDGA